MKKLTIDDLVAGIQRGERRILARAITLLESRRAADNARAQELLARLMPHTGAGGTGGAQRIGITGVPGVGKSTFIDALGTMLLEERLRVAVLAVDPSSPLTGGSILGDKSRMPRLAADDRAFIRPSPSGLDLGGVTRRTRETILLCESAGFDVVLVETVGVGQSETVVSQMVDCFLVLLLPGGGDELQGIKKGVLEIADLVAVNKADGPGEPLAITTREEYASALRYLRPRSRHWRPRAVTVSALTGSGLSELWQLVGEHRRALEQSGELAQRRHLQLRQWLWSLVEERLLARFHEDREVRRRAMTLEEDIVAGRLTPSQAATELLATFGVPDR